MFTWKGILGGLQYFIQKLNTPLLILSSQIETKFETFANLGLVDWIPVVRMWRRHADRCAAGVTSWCIVVLVTGKTTCSAFSPAYRARFSSNTAQYYITISKI